MCAHSSRWIGSVRFLSRVGGQLKPKAVSHGRNKAISIWQQPKVVDYWIGAPCFCVLSHPPELFDLASSPFLIAKQIIRAHTLSIVNERERILKKKQGLWTLSAPSRTAVGPFISAGWNANNKMIIIIIVVIIKKKESGFPAKRVNHSHRVPNLFGNFFHHFPWSHSTF